MLKRLRSSLSFAVRPSVVGGLIADSTFVSIRRRTVSAASLIVSRAVGVIVSLPSSDSV